MGNKKRSFNDRLISKFNEVRFSLMEPVLLRCVRLLNEPEYVNRQSNPLISVYIPTFNRARLLLERAVPAVLSQSYKNIELIIIGDCCSDETEKLLTEIKDPRLRFYNIKKRTYRYPPTVENHWLAGPVVPANEALKLIRGKWIARIDDDDVWTEDHLESLLRFAQSGNYEFASASYVTERYGSKIVVDAKDDNPRIGGTQTWLYRSYLKFFKYNINCWRKSWNRVNDTDIQDRMFRSGVRMGFLDKIVAYVLPRPGEVTVGLEAYRLSAKEKGKHFEFK